MWQIIAVRTDLLVEIGAEPKAIRAVRTDLAVTMGLIFEQIRAVRTEFAVTIERIVANQGGMDIFLAGIWPLFGQIRAV